MPVHKSIHDTLIKNKMKNGMVQTKSSIMTNVKNMSPTEQMKFSTLNTKQFKQDIFNQKLSGTQ